MRAARLRPWAIVAPAVLFAAVLLGTALLASQTLRQRDAAVREGILVRAGHVLEARLREASPDTAKVVLLSFLEERADTVAGVAVVGPAGVIASAGTNTAAGLEISAALGREWRPWTFGGAQEGGTGQSLSPGPRQGGGAGPGFAGGRGAGGRGSPPMKLRLHPAPELGRDAALAGFVVAGGAGAALALVALAVVAARGIAERQRREAAEAEGLRLATVARAGAGLAHRLRNPLAVVKGTAQLLEARVPEAERERAARIVAASGRMETILSRLLDFARPPAPQPTTFDLADLVREVAGRSGPTEVRAGAPVVVVADREHVETVLEELLANARAFDPEGLIDVTVRRERDLARLEVADRGPGLEIDAASAFEPYVTSRPEGTGLGLAIVKTLATANGGSAALAPRPGGGCVASLTIPAVEG